MLHSALLVPFFSYLECKYMKFGKICAIFNSAILDDIKEYFE